MTHTNDAYDKFLQSPLANNPLAVALHSLSHFRGPDRLRQLEKFARLVEEKQEQRGFAISSRGWGYEFANEGIVTKSTFGTVEDRIKECRKKGYLDVHFIRDDGARSLDGNLIYEIDEFEPEVVFLDALLSSCDDFHEKITPDYWDGEKYYLQLFTEKIDLKTLFEPVCREYNVPICNSRGQSDINARAYLIENTQWAADRGLIPVVLYCGDLDPYGEAIANGLRQNIESLKNARSGSVRYKLPENTIFDHFGLNADFIKANNIPWVDSFESGSGAAYKESLPYVRNFIEKYGRRKVEANALVTRPDAGRQLLRTTIEKYLNEDTSKTPALERFADKRRLVKEKLDKFIRESGIKSYLEGISYG